MLTRAVVSLALVLALAGGRAVAAGPFVAEQVTATNESLRLFGGTDPAGGVGDYYVSNGVVEAIVDAVGNQADLYAETGLSRPIQSSAAPSGGYLVDLAHKGKNNDQFAQSILVVGVDGSQLPTYTSIETAVESDAAVVRATGTVPFDGDTGSGPLPRVELGMVTEYRAEGTRPALTLKTTLINTSGGPVPVLNLFDAILWTMKGPLPFTPLPGKGFHHHILPDFNQPQNLVPAFELAPYVVAAGVVDERDGMLDELTGKPVGGACYGIVSGGATVDPDGEGPLPAVPAVGPPLVFGLNNVTTSAVGFGGPNLLLPGASFTYTRHFFVGERSDVSGCTDLIFDHFGVPTVEASGHVLDAAGNGVEASLRISASTPLPIPEIVPGAPLTQVRSAADGAFRLRLPVGVYRVRASASERPTVEGTLTVGPLVSSLDLPAMDEVATVSVAVSVDGEEAPARVSFLPADAATPMPRIGKLFDVLSFDTTRPGACAADSGLTCSADADCAAAGPCLRVCELDPEQRCSSNADCLPGRCVAGFDERPESFGGGIKSDEGAETTAQGNTLYTRAGEGEVEVRPGAYRVVATRGLEYSIDHVVVAANAGAKATVPLEIEQVVDPRRALSADFHIHSARSFDSSSPLFGRVLSFAAEGLEVMVSSEHDFHLDYAPVIEAMGIGDRIGSIPGNEITTGSPPTVGNEFKFGHLNAFPLAVEPGKRRRGAIEDEFVSPNWIYKRLREQNPDVVVQINHPRAAAQPGNTGIGWFTNAKFDPTLPLTASANAFLLDTCVVPAADCPALNPQNLRNVDFDVLELANAARPSDFLAYREVRRDWNWLLHEGEFRPATGVSDSHRLTVETPGYARTYVLGLNDMPRKLDRDAFVSSVRAGRMMVTSGPVISVTARQGGQPAGVGETLVLANPNAPVKVKIVVEAAEWIPVEEVRLLVNGVVVKEWVDVAEATGVERFNETVDLAIDRDSFLVVEAGPELPPDPGIAPLPSPAGPGETVVAYSDVVPGAIAFAFTNPVFVDVDGSGLDLPGLPDCNETPRSVVCEGPVALPADLAHAEDVSFLGRIRIPDELLGTLSGR